MKLSKYIKVAVVALAVLGATACTDTEGTVKLLERQGYTNITIQGYDFFACSEDDTYATKFTAISPAGFETSGTVCAGLFLKGATIRF